MTIETKKSTYDGGEGYEKTLAPLSERFILYLYCQKVSACYSTISNIRKYSYFKPQIQNITYTIFAVINCLLVYIYFHTINTKYDLSNIFL